MVGNDLKAEYNCGKIPNYQKKYILLKVRNQYIENKVLQSKDKKIALVYGKDHFKGLKERFQEQGYQLKKKKQEHKSSHSQGVEELPPDNNTNYISK